MEWIVTTKKKEIIEPVLNNGEPYWLTRRLVEGKSDARNRPAKEVLEDPSSNEPIPKEPVFELMKQGLWYCKKCGKSDIQSDNKPVYCKGCERKSEFKAVTKVINSDLWKLPTWEDIPVEELNMSEVYEDMLKLIKELLVFSKDIEYKIYTLWIISTWKLQCWDTVGYPVFIGIPNSGKSRALRIISQLGYRTLKASGVKQAAIPRLCHYHDVTLLIDEAHTKMNPRTESGVGLLEFVKDSYKRGSTYVTCDNDNQENVIVTRNFGFKAFAGEKTFNPGLLTRSFVFWMDKHDPNIPKLSYVKDDFDKLRTKLVNYRYKTTDPEDLGADFCLKGRTREIYESIISTGKHIGIDVKDIIEFAKERDKREEDALQNTVQYEILDIIKNAEETSTLDDSPDRINVDTILEKLDWFTDDKKRNNDNRVKLGYTLKNMGLETKRTREGRCFFYREGNNDSRLKELYRRYKL